MHLFVNVSSCALRRLLPTLSGFPLDSSGVVIRARSVNRSNIVEHMSSVTAVSKRIAASGLQYTVVSLRLTQTGST